MGSTCSGKAREWHFPLEAMVREHLDDSMHNEQQFSEEQSAPAYMARYFVSLDPDSCPSFAAVCWLRRFSISSSYS
jgi:hypothetical protein